jgi:hypothetical protein
MLVERWSMAFLPLNMAYSIMSCLQEFVSNVDGWQLVGTIVGLYKLNGQIKSKIV